MRVRSVYLCFGLACLVGMAERGRAEPFKTPVWHPDAEWEAAGPVVAPPRGLHWSANLDGPATEIMTKRGRQALWGSIKGYDPCTFQAFDESTGRYHVVAGSARGYLDGPFSRARHGGDDYASRAASSAWYHGGKTRFVYITDVNNGRRLRRLDFVKQEISTVQWEGDPSAGGFTIAKNGDLYVLSPPDRLLILDPEGKQKRQMSVELRPEELVTIGTGWPHSLALDEKHNRLYASGQYAPKRAWHVWYWDLNDEGKFHGEVKAVPGGGGFGGAPGSYRDGWFVYPEGFLCWGPDDPDYRFLYTARTDLSSFYRLDLEKKEVWRLNSVGKAGTSRLKFDPNAQRGTNPEITGIPVWEANGDFLINTGGSGNTGLFRFRRVK